MDMRGFNENPAIGRAHKPSLVQEAGRPGQACRNFVETNIEIALGWNANLLERSDF